jgi:hypothetical protein
MNQSEINKQILNRLNRLEQAIFGGKFEGKTKLKKSLAENFKGATGGLRLLISSPFFNQKRSFGEIKKELDTKHYHYSNQAIQTPLNNLSKSVGPLVGFKESGKKVYAKRK